MEPSSIESKINIDNVLLITKKLNISYIMMSSIVFVSGILFTIAYFSFQNTNQIIHSLFLLIGIALMITGIFLIILKRKKNVYTKTGKSIKRVTFFVLKEQEETLKKMLTQPDIASGSCNFQENGNLKIEVLMSVDRQFSAAQIFEYRPFNFHAITSLYCYENEQSEKFLTFFEKEKKK